MIEIRELRVNRAGRAICSVSELQVSTGERMAILGSNGAGKTTLMRVLCGLESNYSGDCHVDVPYKDRVYVHQVPYMFRGTVLSNVTYGLRHRAQRRSQSELLAMRWLERLGMQDMARESTSHLSGGEKRRVALARGMILKPRLLLLDEPFADMDKTGTASVVSAIADLKETTVLIASPSVVPHGVTTSEYQLQ